MLHHDDNVKLFKAVVSWGSLSGALCLYSFSNALAARDCNCDPSLSSLFFPFVSCAIAEVHWRKGAILSYQAYKWISLKEESQNP
jgi:hypothetical protein